jgi:hypothetical protein
MIGFIVNSVGKWKLANLVKKNTRKAIAMNLDHMESALIVFHVNSEESYKVVTDFALYLRRNEGLNKVDLIAYCGAKEIPNYVDKKKVKVFGPKECNMYGIPINEFLNSSQDYDLMVDFTPESFLPTDSILALSEAKTKVGYHNEEKEYIFDLIIEVSDNQLYLDYSKNIIRYLKMINKV